MGVSSCVGKLPIYCSLISSFLFLYQDIKKVDLVIILFLPFELDLWVLLVQVYMELLKLVRTVWPKDECVINVSTPRSGCYCRGPGIGTLLRIKVHWSRRQMARLMIRWISRNGTSS